MYEKSIGTKMNDLDLSLEVVSRSRQPLRYIRHWIFRKPLQIEVWFQRTTNRKWPMGNQKITWPWKVKLVTPIYLERNIENSWRCSTVGYPSDSLASCCCYASVKRLAWKISVAHASKTLNPTQLLTNLPDPCNGSV